jgi:hypothetical protein
LAANYRLPEFSDDLLKLTTADDSIVRLAAIDALVRLDVNVPEQVLAQISDLDATYIFLARHPDQYENLIRDLLGRKLPDHQWVALNSILLAKPPAGFAAALLRDWSVSLKLTVTEPGRGAGVGEGGAGCVDGSGYERPGFPPVEAYYLYENPRPGDVLLAAGPHPVGYREQKGDYRCGVKFNRDDYRKDYLWNLAGTASWNPYARLPSQAIEWSGPEAFQAAASSLLESGRQMVKYLEDCLASASCLRRPRLTASHRS